MAAAAVGPSSARMATVVYDSGVSFEHAIVEVGHYPEERSGNKGVEPESVTFGVFGGTPYVFVGAERSSIVGVYNVTDPAEPGSGTAPALGHRAGRLCRDPAAQPAGLGQ